jgi:hypothetical protein
MDIVNIILLSVLFIVHWGIMIGLASYIFIRKNKQYDQLYIILVFLLFAHWLLSTECVISYIEKYIIDNTYVIGTTPTEHPSYGLYMYSETINIIITIILFSIIVYTIDTLYRIYNYPYPNYFITVLIVWLVGYMSYFRITKR